LAALVVDRCPGSLQNNGFVGRMLSLDRGAGNSGEVNPAVTVSQLGGWGPS